MAGWKLSFLFTGVVLAHSGVKTIVVDGTAYPPFNSRIDHLLGPVKRVEWSHDVVVTAFNPVTNLSDPAVTCQPNAKAPLLTATARAGAEVTFHWTPIVRMHQGPILSYLGHQPTPNTPAQAINFFKIAETGFDAQQDKWANELAADANNSYTIQLPSDIAAGRYVLRTELVALHGNMGNLNSTQLAGPQVYPHCFTLDIVGDGAVRPAGVRIPGAYRASDYGFAFSPYVRAKGYGAGSGVEQNSRYVPPGPPLYKGRYDAPTGPRPVVQETGAYTGEVAVKYKELVKKLDDVGAKLATFVNSQWSHYEPKQGGFTSYADRIKEVQKEKNAVMVEVDAFKKTL